MNQYNKAKLPKGDPLRYYVFFQRTAASKALDGTPDEEPAHGNWTAYSTRLSLPTTAYSMAVAAADMYPGAEIWADYGDAKLVGVRVNKRG